MKMMTRTRGWLAPLLVMLAAPLGAAELRGAVGWGEALTLSTSLEAEVVQATARSGESVRKGALLVQLDDGVPRAQRVAARAEVAHQALLLSEAKNELQRSEELYDRTLLSDHDLDLARIAHAAANSSYLHASAALAAAERSVAHTRLVAPFDGVVLQRHVQAREMVNGRLNSVPLYTLVAEENRVVRLVVPKGQAAGLRLNDELVIEGVARRYGGRVEAITSHGDQGDQLQVTIGILTAPGKGEIAAIGESVTVNLP
jgi:RND family efflux transporter MFP subunit